MRNRPRPRPATILPGADERTMNCLSAFRVRKQPVRLLVAGITARKRREDGATEVRSPTASAPRPAETAFRRKAARLWVV
jgi:hypothetical protein